MIEIDKYLFQKVKVNFDNSIYWSCELSKKKGILCQSRCSTLGNKTFASFWRGGGLNRKNRITYAESRKHVNSLEAIFNKCKFLLTIVIWCGLTLKVATEQFVIIDNKKIDSRSYVRYVLPLAKNEGKNLFKTNKWAFQQDGATAHTVKRTQK
jgi:hypothetical protein